MRTRKDVVVERVHSPPLAHDGHGASRRANYVVSRRAEYQKIQGAAPVNTHHDELGSSCGRLLEYLPTRPTVHDRSVHRAIGLRLLRD